jgi:hypothetical protein
MNLQGRLAKLEAASGVGGRRLFVIERLESETSAEAEAAAGIRPFDTNTVIYLTRFSVAAFSSNRQRVVTVQELRA